MRSIPNILQKITVGLTMPLISLLMIMGNSGVASAAGCHSFTASLGSYNADQYFVYSSKYTVPSWSTCHDINVTSFTSWDGTLHYCGNVRVRFYTSAGGSYFNPWKYICDSSTLKPIATDVLDGTVYRIEVGGNIFVKLGVYD